MSSEFPKDFDTTEPVYGHGGVLIYRISRDQALKIAKQFPKDFSAKPPLASPIEGEQLFYMNINHGERHIVFSIGKHQEDESVAPKI